MSRVICTNGELHSKAASVVRDLDFVAGATMGPKGQRVAIGKSYGGTQVTKDGVTAIKEMGYSDKKQQAIYLLVREGATASNQVAGDGSTTYTVLVCQMMRRLLACKAAGMDPNGLKIGIEAAKKQVLDYIKSVARPVSQKKEIYNVAKISSDGDEDVAEIISNIMEQIGKNGVITIDEGKTVKKVDHELVTGMCFNQGYLSSYFCTNTDKMVAELDNAYVFVTDKKISSIAQMIPLLEAVVQSGRPLLIIADEVEGEPLATIVFNRIRGGLKACAVKAPGFGERKAATLEDIATLTGTQLFTDALGIKIENITLDMLGSAKKVTVYKDKTVIIGGAGSKADIDSRVALINRSIEESTSDYDKEKLRERAARLSGGVAVIKVGGQTEAEVKERKDRYEDALNATRAAVEEGIVMGGGIVLYNAKKALSEIKMPNDVEQAGFDIVVKSLSACMDRIASNAGYNGDVIANKLDEMNAGGGHFVFDARTGQYVNAFESGIVDPAKVARTAIDHAASTTALFSDIAALIVDKEENNEGACSKKSGGAGAAGAGFGGDMDF